MTAKQPSRSQRRKERLASLTDVERLDSLIRLSGYLWVWHEALDRQAHRVLQSSFKDSGPEAWLWAAGLGALLRCVRLAEDLGAPTADLLQRFDQSVPDGQAVRDVLEHLEDYELGIGDRQQPGQGRLEFLYQRSAVYDRGQDALRAVDVLTLQGVGLSLSFTEAQEAVTALADQVLEAVHDARDRLGRAGVELPPLPPRPDVEVWKLLAQQQEEADTS